MSTGDANIGPPHESIMGGSGPNATQVFLDNENTVTLSGGSCTILQVHCLHQTLQALLIAGFIVGAIPPAKALIVGASSPLRVIQDSISLLGDGAIPGIILLMGGHLVKGLSSSKLRPVTIVLIICVKFVLLPVIGIFIVKGASNLGLLPADPMYQYVLMIQYTVPPAMSIGTIAQLFSVGEKDCSVLFLWTYLLAAIAVTFWSTVYMWILFS